MAARPTKIVLTGAPGSGKSTIVAELARRHPGRLVAVGEAATQFYDARGARWDRLDLDGKRAAQRGIYQLQRRQEADADAAHGDKVHLLDRGTIDGAAYWPDGPEAYWVDLGSSAAAELARYDRVIVLESAAAIGLYDGDASNPRRFEDAAGALASAALLDRLWGSHPNLTHVAAEPDFARKLAAVEALVLG